MLKLSISSNSIFVSQFLEIKWKSWKYALYLEIYESNSSHFKSHSNTLRKIINRINFYPFTSRFGFFTCVFSGQLKDCLMEFLGSSDCSKKTFGSREESEVAGFFVF